MLKITPELTGSSIGNTLTIQSAIDQCCQEGGGKVLIPKGTHLCGSLVIRSNVNLHLAEGAVLKGSPDFKDYPSLPGGFKDAVGHLRSRCMIFARQAENIIIDGPGVIDGNGGVFGKSHPDHLSRPFLLRIMDCTNVSLNGITLQNSPAWVCHIQRSAGIRVSKVTIRSHCNCNNDGIDVDSCENVEIRDCDIDTGDDALCFKTTSAKPCKNISVENCRLKSDCGALKFGTESYGDFSNISVRNCEIYDTRLCAIKFCAMDGGRMENITLSDIRIKNSTGPFFIRLGDRKNVYMEKLPKSVGRIRNLKLENITADFMDRGKEHSGAFISGVPHQPVENIEFKNIEIVYPGGGTPADARNLPEEQISNYPEPSYFGVMPAHAFYIRHAKNITMRDVRIKKVRPDARAAVVAVNVENSDLNLTECDV